MYHASITPSRRRALDQYRVCQGHLHANWVYLSPPAILEPGRRTGRYRRGTTTLLVDENGDSRITAGDLAVAVIDELENPCGERHLTVARDRAPDQLINFLTNL